MSQVLNLGAGDGSCQGGVPVRTFWTQLLLASLVFGFIGVEHACPDTSLKHCQFFWPEAVELATLESN